MKADATFAKEVSRRRHEKHLSQAELSARIGCSQTAISYIERGKFESVSKEKLTALCQELGLAVPSSFFSNSVLGFCGNPDCPLGWREVVSGALTIQPAMFRIDPDEMRFCKACGRPLLTTCQEGACRATPQEGASFCTKCGTALVNVEKHQQLGDLEEYKERMNHRCKQFRAEGEKIEYIAPQPAKDPQHPATVKGSPCL